MRDHAHGDESLGVSPAPFDHGTARLRQRSRLKGRLEREPLGRDRQQDQDYRSNRCGHADPEMENEADAEIDRYPRQIEQRDWTKSAQKRADTVQIAHRPGSVAAEPHKRRQPDDCPINLSAQRFVEADANTSKDASSN